MADRERCVVCGPTSPFLTRYWYCDRREGPWCEKHFRKIRCRSDHGEGCATFVIDPEPTQEAADG